MPFPETRRLMQDAGYSFVAAKRCPCGAEMELWLTPKNAMLPMNPMTDDDAKAESHFATCPRAAQFRKRNASATSHGSHPGQTPPGKPTARAEDTPPPTTKSGHSPRG